MITCKPDITASHIINLWSYYCQTCQDCGPYHTYTLALHDEVYLDMFKFLMNIESMFTEYEENKSLYAGVKNGYQHQEHLVNNIEDYEKFIRNRRNEDKFFNKGLYFLMHKYTQDEESIYERIESSLVKPLISLKQSYTYNF